MSDVAKTILAQLGGNRFLAMTGAKNLVGSKDSLSFQIPNAKNKIKGVRITLNDSDTYDMTFGYLNKKTFEYVIVSKANNVYNDMIQEVFTNHTGLYTKL